MSSATELRLQQRTDALEAVMRKHEDLISSRGDGELSETDRDQIKVYRDRQAELQEEITGLAGDVEAAKKAEEQSRMIRRAGLEATGGDPEGPVYRTFSEYARDLILTGNIESKRYASKVQALVPKDDLERAEARIELLKRTANTLSSDVAGLIPPQHISQIFQVIDTSRPLVASAQRDTLVRGTLTYPRVDTRPVVAIQNTEKTAAGDTGMDISMQTTTASVYLGGGDLSWQAVNWSTPNALDLWFKFAAADYALKTEQDAADILQYSAHLYRITTTVSASPTFAQFMTAIGAGYAAVYANSGRLANTVYMAPDRFGYLLGSTSDAFTQFTTVNADNVGPLNIVVSRGIDAGVVVVGDSAGLLVAETAGAPVDLQVVEPAIGGYEVGVIGAFEAVVVDEGAFSTITTTS